MTEREKIAARIRALLQKTVENGCTEDEAIAAAAKAAEMLERYNLSVDEVEMRASPFARHNETHDDAVGQRLWKVASAIADLTGARYWVGRAGMAPEITFFGFEHEVEVAKYLLHICARAMRDHEGRLNRELGLLTLAVRRRRIAPFLDGMADRLYQRIRALIPPKATGTGLVVLHDALVTQAMEDAGINLSDQRSRSSRSLEAGYLDGIAAAERVALNQGLSRSGDARALLA
jgi:hypothetical protein